MLKSNPRINIGRHIIEKGQSCFVIAEIGHNHQGNIEIAKQMIDAASECKVQAVKFQKRFNKSLYVSEMYNKPYDHENSFGKTYGEHRDALEFNKEQYKELKRYAESKGLEFFATAFDFESVDFLEEIDVSAYKIASGDITNYPLLEYISTKKKPVFLSTGASSMDEVRSAYRILKSRIDQICIMQCTAVYPIENYSEVNLNVIKTYQEEFPDAVIGYSGHDNGIVLPVVAYVLGAVVIEKHFTLSRAMKGTDHKFSLEPQGLKKIVRDLQRTREALGSGEKRFYPSERDARRKMGKSIVLKHEIKAGMKIDRELVTFKSPGDGISPSDLDHIIGKYVVKDLPADIILLWQHLK